MRDPIGTPLSDCVAEVPPPPVVRRERRGDRPAELSEKLREVTDSPGDVLREVAGIDAERRRGRGLELKPFDRSGRTVRHIGIETGLRRGDLNREGRVDAL